MPQILIQPTVNDLIEYTAFAERHGLGFELIDFSFPSASKEKRTQAFEHYLDRKNSGLMGTRAISMHGVFIDVYLNSPDPEIREVAERRILENLRMASGLGLSFSVFHTNALPMMGRDSYYRNWLRMHAAFWKEALRTFEGTILLENMWDRNPSLLLQLLEAVGSDRLKVCLDTGHVRVHSECPMEVWFRTLGPHIAYIHMNDNHGAYDEELAVGAGIIDWRQFDALVREHCAEPVVVLETDSLDAVAQGITFLSGNGLYPFQ